jgi:DNA-binding CsgD family transcriptional regulator
MKRSQQLRLKDLRGAYRLIMECRELGHDPVLWRRHMFLGLCPLVGARVAAGGEIRDFGKPTQVVLQSVDVRGFSQTVSRYLAEDGIRHDPVFRRFAQIPGQLVTRCLGQLIDPADWHRSETFRRYMRPAGIDSRIISFYRLPYDVRTVTAITLHRGTEDPSFGLREARLVHYFHHELSRMLGRELATVAGTKTSGLPLRQRQVLDCLLNGDSEKQVARRLGLSPHTVHTHINRLHQRFGVQSRGELLACCRKAV